MRLVRVAVAGGARLGVVVDETVRLLDEAASAALGDDLPAVAASPAALDLLRALAEDPEPSPPRALELSEARLLAPVGRPGKILAVGLNYAGHIAEGRAATPREPLCFAKFPSSIIGPGAAITWDPALTQAVDFEAELAVVIGRAARGIPAAVALEHVLGYTCLNDVSARDLQFGDGQWVRGKSLDTFCPLGPWVVTADEIPDPQGLAISCTVSGERLQDATTADMLHGVADLIASFSRAFTLEPGDVIATGTPPGVGWFREPRRLLHDGDEVVVEIENIGALRNPARELTQPQEPGRHKLSSMRPTLPRG